MVLDEIEVASNAILSSGLVAFPTETVYGLGANAFDASAVKKIFLAKGRPSDNPLIVHVHSKEQVMDFVKEIPETAEKLINEFWPGPLTFVLNSNGKIPSEVTAGLKTVAVRMPKNKIALELIKCADVPIVAPSANLSGKPSPTIAEHVIEDLNGKIDVIIDGGSVNIGLESTVIDLTKKIPVILRPGKISKKQIEKVIGEVKEHKKIDIDKPLSPGMKYRHYAPKAKVVVIKDDNEIKYYSKKFPYLKIKYLKYGSSSKMAKNLFKDFRLTDKLRYDLILVKEIDDDDFSSAVMDRLRKASEE